MTGSAWPVTLSEIASERRRLPCRRLVAPDLTGMRVLRKERFKYAISNHSIRRSGVAITKMLGGDRGCLRVKPANSLVPTTSASSATSALVNALNAAGIPWSPTEDAGTCSRRDV